jgi:hypothetical protein
LPTALAAGPTDAFLWLALFWSSNASDGFQEARLPLLAMSYASGPNEGWVGVKRSAITLAIWERLTPALREAAAGEFAGLVQARRFREMPEIFQGPGWAARDVLLPRLAQVDEPTRRAFWRALYRAGIDVDVPGVAHPDDRPWSR